MKEKLIKDKRNSGSYFLKCDFNVNGEDKNRKLIVNLWDLGKPCNEMVIAFEIEGIKYDIILPYKQLKIVLHNFGVIEW